MSKPKSFRNCFLVFRSLTHAVSILAPGILLVTSLVSADTVTSVSCSTPTAPFETSTSDCDALGSYGYSTASVSASEVLPTTSNQAATINAASSVSALQYGVHGISGTATAQSSLDLGIIFDTSGPVRNGFLELSFLQNSWTVPVNGSMDESLTVGSYSVNPNGSSLASLWIPIELGSEFGFDYTQSIAAIGSSISGLSSGAIDSQITLQAFEANGTTSVQLFDPPGNPAILIATPEPRTVGVVLAGIALVLMFKSRRLNSRGD